MRVLVAAADPSATITRLRVVDPLSRWMAGAGADGQPQGELRQRPLHDTARADLAWCELMVLQRGTASRHLALMEAAASMGRTVIYEIDDLLTEPAPHLLHADALQRDARWVRAGLEAADLVTVSTARLAGLLGLTDGAPVADPARLRWALVPNTAQPSADPMVAPPAQHAGLPVSVLVAASDRVAGGPAWQALAALLAEAPGAVTVEAVGPVADDLAAAGIPFRGHPLMPRADFVRWAASLPNPLALIPLDDSRFSAGKSAVKWYDYAEAGVPTLASNAGPYRDILEHERTGWLVGPSAQRWLQVLRTAVDDPAARSRIAQAARSHVRLHHHAGLMVLAWGQALALAMARTETRRRLQADPPDLASASWHLALRDRADRLKLALRRWNRERLSRRQP